ncbi:MULTISPECIES: CidA/LrgA family protein [Bacillaceae]|uniref:CidA/LrgA family protein n=1 Tax=Bacillaceae TaxID=186817 RepID=UPI00101CA9A1|nr:CidA/LrgA family protein [Ectobacillus funiculus]
MKNFVFLILQLLGLWLLNEAGYWIVETLQLPLPGNVMGMLLLFALLATKTIPLRWIEQASGLLIKHLAFFFIPIAVGLMNFGDLFLQNGVAFITAIIGSAAIGMLITGFTSQKLASKKGESVGEHHRNAM